MAKKKSSTQKRERINTGTDARLVKRTATGRFKESDDVGTGPEGRSGEKGQEDGQAGYGDQGDLKKKR